ncbi:MAG: hypothetical protein ACLQPH_18940, partial [Acidimicrobiales bacterium]
MGTGAILLVLELRQSTNHPPEGVTADRGSRPILRLAGEVGAVVAVALSRVAPAAAIGPASAWFGLALLWCGIALRFW